MGTRDPALLEPKVCAGCHPGQYAEWASSRHAHAFRNEIFQNEFVARQKTWCVHCHAPTDEQLAAFVSAKKTRDRMLPQTLLDGVSCAACHIRQGRLVSRRRAQNSPHSTVVANDFGSPAFCADCHQFSFPRFDDAGRAIASTAWPMQDTVAQFARGPFARGPDGCLQCHGSRFGHAFAGAHDVGLLRASVSLDLCRLGTDRVAVDLRNVGAGHNVPTGDVHRHLLVRLWRSSTPQQLADVFVGRRFAPAPRGGKKTIWDSSLAPGQTRRFIVPTAAFGGSVAEPFNLRLEYVYGPQTTAHRTLADSTVHATLLSHRVEFQRLTACTHVSGRKAAVSLP